MRLIVVLLLFTLNANAQNFKQFAQPIIEKLCSKEFAGRGYQQNGLNTAANYLSKEFKTIGLKPIEEDYFQNYISSVNIITDAQLSIDGKPLKAGAQFLVNPGAKSVSGKYKLFPFDVLNAADKSLFFNKLEKGFNANETVLYKNVEDARQFKKVVDSIGRIKKIPSVTFKSALKKLMWSVADEVDSTIEITVPDTLINQADEVELSITNQFIPKFLNKNIIGLLPGKNKKSKDFIVFTAHYDHLGMLGKDAFFPGASDNASGTAMLLSLANYFSKNKLDNPILFILFSGEENGLLGSKYFVENPLINLSQIKMLINLDIMGCAQEGVTVVNGEKEKKAFDLLVKINNNKKYLPELKIRGKAANSDHYFFSEVGVPAIFLFSNGGLGFYHDVWDKASNINLKNFDEVANLLIDFVNQYP